MIVYRNRRLCLEANTTHSFHISTSCRRGASSARLNRLQAHLQRVRAAIRSGVKAQYSSPRSIFSLSDMIKIIVIFGFTKAKRGEERSKQRGKKKTREVKLSRIYFPSSASADVGCVSVNISEVNGSGYDCSSKQRNLPPNFHYLNHRECVQPKHPRCQLSPHPE